MKGGNQMAEQEKKPFHFDLSETLYFHRNEGVSEMLGIGLDPEISIESHPDYVSVRGIIALTGEYVPVFVDDRSDLEDDEEIQNRYFKRVERDEEGVCDFLHHFPIDISIPHERIKNLDDLTVSVHHFDYTITDPRKLELEATVEIDGLEYDSNREEDDISENDETDLIDEKMDSTEQEDTPDERIAFDVKLTEEQPEPSTEEESTRLEEDPPVIEEESTIDEEEDEKIVHLEKRSEPILKEEERELEESAEEESEAEVPERNNYLLDLFEEEEADDGVFAQMRMYIVQEDDTLETIAERYQVSVTKIQRVNRLETTSIEHGEILYVPN